MKMAPKVVTSCLEPAESMSPEEKPWDGLPLPELELLELSASSESEPGAGMAGTSVTSGVDGREGSVGTAGVSTIEEVFLGLLPEGV